MAIRDFTHLMSDAAIERFWALVDRRGENDCWFWKGNINRLGYGQMRIHGSIVRAHRVSYSLAGNSLMKYPMVCHTCDNRSCVNPKHLYGGTQADNMRDMVERGRSRRGERNQNASMTDAQVLAMRKDYESGMLYREIAHKYGKGESGLVRLLFGPLYSHIPVAKRRPKARGERCNAKLTSQDVVAIRQAASSGISTKELATRFNVTPHNIRAIVSRRSWKHIS